MLGYHPLKGGVLGYSVMNVKCPYCGCCYNVNSNLLQNPIGNEKLGYGWWLRCHKCRKKWWLQNSVVAEGGAPLKADRSAKIDQLSRLVRKQKESRSVAKRRLTAPLSIVLFIVFAYLAYLNKDVFCKYLIGKIEHVSQGLAQKIVMENVKYVIREQSGKSMINISGIIRNEDRTVAKISGVKITIFDGDAKVKTWDNSLDPGFILPGDNLSFSIDEQLDVQTDNIRVEVSII
jgi:hypothetical protein